MNMKRIFIITSIFSSALAITGCGGAQGENPGQAYAPDMYYSRAYETYNYNVDPESHDLKGRGAYYNASPVPGTVARGDAFTFPLPEGDSGYARAASFVSPLPGMTITPPQMKEAERLYQINCGICHGSALDGNGPLWKGGDGPYPAAPRNLLDDYTKGLSDGQIYHAITYGKGLMGSYASQVYPEQRWWITAFIRSKQGSGKAAADSTAATPQPANGATMPGANNATPAANNGNSQTSGTTN
jgi:hypothetical protein